MNRLLFYFITVFLSFEIYAFPVRVTSKNVQELQISKEYIITDFVDLNQQKLILPDGCKLIFKRKGCFSNGEIYGNNIEVINYKNRVRFCRDVIISGHNWCCKRVCSEWFEAIPDCILTEDGCYVSGTDNCTAFNNCFKFNNVSIKPGTYYIEGHIQTDRSNQKIIGNNSTIKGRFKNRYQAIITISGANNVVMEQLNLIGWKDEGEDSTQWAHGLLIINSNNICINKICSFKCQGDGISLGEVFVNNQVLIPRQVVINNCICSSNYRCGLSITGAEDVAISNCLFEKTQGQAPQTGIDIEPNVYKLKNGDIITSTCSTIRIKASNFENNVHSGINIESPASSEEIGTFPVSDIVLDSCNFKRNGISIWRVQKMTISNCNVNTDINTYGVVFQNATQRDIKISGVQIRNNSYGPPEVIGIFVCPGHERENILFENISVKGTFQYCFFIPSNKDYKGTIKNISFKNIDVSNGWNNFFVGDMVSGAVYSNITSSNKGQSIHGGQYDGWTWGWSIHKDFE